MAEKSKTKKTREVALLPYPDTVDSQHYYYITPRHWPSLIFILPMLIIFELGTYLRQGGTVEGGSQLVATYLIERLVRIFGDYGFYFPGLLVVVILIACHILAKHPWKFDVSVLAGMIGESVIWTIPLLVFERVLHLAVLAGADSALAGWTDQVIRCFGAGIYEELVFRFICMNILSILLVDLAKLPKTHSTVFIIIASAIIFAAQHHPPLGAAPFNFIEFLFRTAAGIYLAGLFFFRGFGIAVGTHAFFDVIVVTIAAVRA
ncbi:MAG: CPBP family glutamic-type intramembrane protease [Planctomycetota bacterium]|jgi:hypothetical protein